MVLSVDMTDFVLRCYDQGFPFSPLIGGDLFFVWLPFKNLLLFSRLHNRFRWVFFVVVK